MPTTITSTLGALASAETVLQKLVPLRWPVRVAYRLYQIATALEEKTRYFHETSRNWFKELGERDGDRYHIPAERSGEFLSRMAELQALDATITIEPLTLDALETGEDPGTRAPIKLTIQEIAALAPLLDRLGDVPVVEEPCQMHPIPSSRHGTSQKDGERP